VNRLITTATLAGCSILALSAATVEQVAGGGRADTPAPALQTKLIEPFAVAFDSRGNWYICEYQGERITRVDPAGKAFPFAGSSKIGRGGDGGPASSATFHDPHGIVIGKDDKMYVADTLNHVIRRIDLKAGSVENFAGMGEAGYGGDGGPASLAQFNGTFALDINATGDRLYIADLNNRRVRMIDLKSRVVSTIAGNGESGIPADGSPAAKSPLVDPRAVAVDSKSNVYILERRSNALRMVDLSGKIRTLIAPDPDHVIPPMNGPKHLCIDGKDRVIIADSENHLIRMYDPVRKGLITIAGTGIKGTKIVADDPLQTELNRPHGVAIGPHGDLYVSDSYNHRILRISGY
jgi:sugar lactone lactonase YvrE